MFRKLLNLFRKTRVPNMQNEIMYFWYKLTRVTSKDCPRHKFFASTGTDAETGGRFDDSITRIGYATIFPGQTSDQVFELYKDQIDSDCKQLGYNAMQLVSISKREYDSFRRLELKAIESFVDEFNAPAYAGKRMVRK
jgi:hypothetical protein